MVTQGSVAKAKSLLAAGVFESKVSRATGLSRNRVRKLAAAVDQEIGLTPELVERVKGWLADGMFECKISRRTGLTRAVIRKIATGNYTLSADPPRRSESLHHAFQKPFRCPGCGGMVYPGENGECTLCLITNSKVGKHSNVELATAEDCYGALHDLTFAASENLDFEEAVMDQEWTLTEEGKAVGRHGEYLPTPAEIEAATAEFRQRHLAELQVVG